MSPRSGPSRVVETDLVQMAHESAAVEDRYYSQIGNLEESIFWRDAPWKHGIKDAVLVDSMLVLQ